VPRGGEGIVTVDEALAVLANPDGTLKELTRHNAATLAGAVGVLVDALREATRYETRLDVLNLKPGSYLVVRNK
jgi:hypothetical protein